jgi:hypothetical protein
MFKALFRTANDRNPSTGWILTSRIPTASSMRRAAYRPLIGAPAFWPAEIADRTRA